MWISGLINPHGAPARVVAAVAAGRITAVISRRLLDELATVLTRPKLRRWIALADATSATIITGDDDLLAAGLEPPAITPRQLLDRLQLS